MKTYRIIAQAAAMCGFLYFMLDDKDHLRDAVWCLAIATGFISDRVFQNEKDK